MHVFTYSSNTIAREIGKIRSKLVKSNCLVGASFLNAFLKTLNIQ